MIGGEEWPMSSWKHLLTDERTVLYYVRQKKIMWAFQNVVWN